MTDSLPRKKYIYRSCSKSSATTYQAPAVQHCHLAPSMLLWCLRRFKCFSLKNELERELNLTTGRGCCDDTGSGALNSGCGLISDCALSRTACVDDLVWRLQVGVVENVEELSAKLEPGPLSQHGRF